VYIIYYISLYSYILLYIYFLIIRTSFFILIYIKDYILIITTYNMYNMYYLFPFIN